MLLIKTFSSEWCDVDVYEVAGKLEASGFEVVARDVREFRCIKGMEGEKIFVTEELVKCLKNYNADIVVISECEFDYPHVVLIYLREKKIVHFFCTMERRGLWKKIDKYQRGEYVIKLERK